MIPVLYEPKEDNFTTNGVGLLVDAISCVVTEERNGSFELVLKYPTKSLLSKYISEDCIIKAKPNDTDTEQLFRIYGRSKPMKGAITWKAEHISYELNGYPVNKVKITGKNAGEAIGQLLEQSVIENNYTAWSDITTRNNTEIDEVVSVRKALGGVERSILDVWGGEYRFNNYRVELLKARGKDNGVQIRYGKNMLDGQQEKNISNVITAVFPYCYYTPEKAEGATETPDPVFASLPEKFIKTPNADKYARIKCEPVDFSDKFEDGAVITEAMLRKVAADYAISGIDEPEVSIKTTFAALHQTKEYANIKALEKVGPCDIVTVIFEDLEAAVKAKIIKYGYDVLHERFDSVEIGSVRTNLTKEISKQQSENEKIIIKTATRAEKIQKDIEKTILNVTAAITGNSGGHVVLYPAENPQEIFIMDTDDTATAKNVWRWNLAGLGHSSNGIGGPFTTAITADGQIVADFITAGKLTGLILEAGTVKAEALDVLYKQSVTEYADKAAQAAGEAAVKESETRISAVKGEIELEVKEVDMANRHDYITNGDGSAGSEGWYFNNTSYITTTNYLGSSCFKITRPTNISSYIRFYVPGTKAGKWILRFKVATEAAYATTARVQSSFYSSQTTATGTIKATEWTTIEREITIPSDGNRYMHIYNAVQNTTVYITDVELLGTYKDYAAAKLSVHSDEIAAEVERATGAEATLKTSIKVNADAIKLKVTSGDVSSLIEQNASSIRLRATTIQWSSTYSSMSSSGVLKCSSAELRGTIKCGSDSGYWVQLSSGGKLTGGYGSTQHGYIDYSASAYNQSTGKTHKGIQIQGGCLRISVNEMATRSTSNTSTLAYVGATGTFKYISEIQDNGGGSITWWNSTVSFENGLMVSSL